MTRHVIRARILVDCYADRLCQLLFRSTRRIGIEDPGDRLHDLCECPVRDAVAVRDGAALLPAKALRRLSSFAE